MKACDCFFCDFDVCRPWLLLTCVFMGSLFARGYLFFLSLSPSLSFYVSVFVVSLVLDVPSSSGMVPKTSRLARRVALTLGVGWRSREEYSWLPKPPRSVQSMLSGPQHLSMKISRLRWCRPSSWTYTPRKWRRPSCRCSLES